MPNAKGTVEICIFCALQQSIYECIEGYIRIRIMKVDD